MTLTNYATGEPPTKPAFYVDANIHATELSGSVAALKLIGTVLSGYGERDVSPTARQPYALRNSRVSTRMVRNGPMADKAEVHRSSTRLIPIRKTPLRGWAGRHWRRWSHSHDALSRR